MDTRRTILHATDFEEPARAVLPLVEGLARALEAHLHLVHVRPSGVEAFVSSGLVERHAEDRLAAIAHKLEQSGVATSVEVVARTDVAVALARAAEERHAELIVIGAHRRAGLIESSSTSRIVRAAQCPVWIARGADLPRRIACGVDLSPESGHAVELAARLGRELGASLAVVSAVELPSINPSGLEPGELRAEEERHRAERAREVEALVASRGITGAEIRCVWGRPDDVLVALAVDGDCDLLVLGRRHSRDLRSFALGTTAQRVASSAPCSVVVMGEGRRH